jgi:O-methyltransferase domain/Dimerisation domain
MNTTNVREEAAADPMAFMRLIWPGPLVVQGVRAAAELRIADRLADGPRSAADLAAAAEANPKTLARLLTALSSVGLFRNDSDGNWHNTPLSEFIREDHPRSMRPWALLIGHPMFWQPIGELHHSIVTGKESFTKTFERGFYEFLKADPAAGTLFNRAMEAQPSDFMSEVPKIYAFSRFETLADLGGGKGRMLSMILREHPSVHGVLLELPDVVDEVEPSLVEEFGGRLKLQAGSFFDAVPEGLDCYMTARVIHGFADDEALKILKNIRKAMRPDSTLLLIEGILDDSAPPNYAMMDMLMLTLAGSMERTEEDFRTLLADSGFKLDVIRHGHITLMECRPL